jgi:hypothetical protein
MHNSIYCFFNGLLEGITNIVPSNHGQHLYLFCGIFSPFGGIIGYGDDDFAAGG